jgi:hypothetical protein
MGPAPVLVVVKRGAVGARAHDGGEPHPLGAAPAEAVLDPAFQLVLVHAGLSLRHRLQDRLSGDGDRPAQPADLVFVLDLPQRGQLVLQVANAHPAPAGGAVAEQAPDHRGIA